MLVGPIVRYQVKDRLARLGVSLALTAYFALLGFGFMAVELSSIQVMTLFLGHPTYALTVILLGILAFAGLGSALARYIPRSMGPAICLLLAAISLAASFGIIPLVHSLIGASFVVRVAVTLLLLMLAGLPMGAPMALGIREIGDRSSLHVAWAWACNGAAGVLGTNICMIVMIYFGMSALFWIGAPACYLFACFLLRLASAARRRRRKRFDTASGPRLREGRISARLNLPAEPADRLPPPRRSRSCCPVRY